MNIPYLMFVTWFLAGQPPNSYQASFVSRSACEDAKTIVVREAEGMRVKMVLDALMRSHPLGIPDNLTIAGVVAPQVSVVCVPNV